MKKILKNKQATVRRILAIISILALTLLFIDFRNIIPSQLHIFAHLQWIPALLSTTAAIILLLVISILWGRIYCSILCPLGILQDILLRIFPKKRKKKKYKYHAPNNILRYSILGITLFSVILGTGTLLIWLDPYSNFGRIVSSLFRPIAIEINNLLTTLFNAFGYYGLYVVSATDTLTWISVGSALTMFVILIVFTWRRGRLYCNTICPVGTLLGLLAPFSLYKVRIESDKCTACGLCASHCKAECIDSKNKKIDPSRCISCYNCINSCPNGALVYNVKRKAISLSTATPVLSQEAESRRNIIKASGILIASAAVDSVKANTLPIKRDEINNRRAIMPPGAESRDLFDQHCTACLLCVSKCPSHVLIPSGIKEYGLQGVMQPHLSYKDGYCNYNCNACSEVCPTHAINPIDINEKRLTQIGIAQFRKNLCVVFTDETDCGACSEHCPTQAITMVPYKEGLTIPHLDPSICIGCGGCEYICPVLPYQAIYVEGLKEQKEAIAPHEEQQTENKVADFGF